MKKLLGISVEKKVHIDIDPAGWWEVNKQFSEDMRLVNATGDVECYLLATELHRYWSSQPVYPLFKEQWIKYLKKSKLTETIKLMLRATTEEYEQLLKSRFMGEGGNKREVMLRILKLYFTYAPDRAAAFSNILTAKDRKQLNL